MKLFQLKKYPQIKFGKIRFGQFPNLIIDKEAKKVIVENNFNTRNFIHILVKNKAELYIGENVFMNNFCSINCLDQITIGENSLFGENVKLYDHNHLYNQEPPFEVKHQEFTTSPIKIGKNCWIGSNVTILKGVTIGDNSIIGAGCTIYKDIPSNAIVTNGSTLIIKSR